MAWRQTLWKCIRWFLFRFDAEAAHRMTVHLIELGSGFQGAPLRILSNAQNPNDLSAKHGHTVFGIRFASRVGLAAGFDKDAEMIASLPHLGFGFAELGTVTPRPQPGNDQPRLFRNPQTQVVFNRMGFNGAGAEIVSQRLAECRAYLPTDFRVGVNVGKNKDTSNEDASKDYLRAAQSFRDLADYVVVNVSSPNTPGLRALQTVEALQPIIESVKNEILQWTHPVPLLLKLAPEVSGAELAEILITVEKWGTNGFVLTNTLAGSWERGLSSPLTGGLSGIVLTEKSLERLKEAKKVTRLPIISVGGIMNSEDAVARVQAGSDLVQIYSGWIFRGPTLPSEITQRL